MMENTAVASILSSRAKIVNISDSKVSTFIKKIELMGKKASTIGDLHQTLTLSGGGEFRVELLQLCSNSVTFADIEHQREEKNLI